jgi:uncharacterized membrane protein
MEIESHLPSYQTNDRIKGLGENRQIWKFFFTSLAIIISVFSIPFLRPIYFSWADMNLYLQILVFLLAAGLYCHACLSISFPNAFRLFGFSFFFSYLGENLGIRWAGLCGSQYSYDPALLPKLPGDVPIFILFIWFILAYLALGFLSPLTIRPKGSLSLRKLLLKSALCGFFIMASGFSLDPLGTSTKMWVWHEPGDYFGTPIRNFGAWFLVGVVICLGYLLMEKSLSENQHRISSQYSFMTVSFFLTILCFSVCLIQLGSFWPIVLSLIFISPYCVFRILSTRRISNS